MRDDVAPKLRTRPIGERERGRPVPRSKRAERMRKGSEAEKGLKKLCAALAVVCVVYAACLAFIALPW